jgi:hypothetical protein
MTMKRRRRILLAVAFAASASLACSFMLDFDLEGKPCGNFDTCHQGFVCAVEPEGNVCVRPDAGEASEAPADAGAPEGS